MRLSGLVVIALSVAACGPSKVCRTPEAPPSYAAGVQAIVTAKCLNCHSTKVKGADRHGAADSLNYDTYAKMKDEAELGATRVEKGEMPLPNVGVENLTADEKDLFLQWSYCGANP